MEKASAIRENNLSFGWWQMKNDTLAGSFGFVGTENGFNHRQINNISKPFFSTYKSNANTTDLNS